MNAQKFLFGTVPVPQVGQRHILVKTDELRLTNGERIDTSGSKAKLGLLLLRGTQTDALDVNKLSLQYANNLPRMVSGF